MSGYPLSHIEPRVTFAAKSSAAITVGKIPKASLDLRSNLANNAGFETVHKLRKDTLDVLYTSCKNASATPHSSESRVIGRDVELANVSLAVGRGLDDGTDEFISTN